MGDSHVRRMRDTSRSYAFFRNRGIDIEFRCQGGATADFLAIPASQKCYDLIVFAIGSNDLDQGKSPYNLIQDLFHHAWQYVYNQHTPKVVVMSLFPRAATSVNHKIDLFNHMLNSYSNDYCVGWLWSKKLTMRLRFDGVHLTKLCYKHSLKYLASPIYLFGRLCCY